MESKIYKTNNILSNRKNDMHKQIKQEVYNSLVNDIKSWSIGNKKILNPKTYDYYTIRIWKNEKAWSKF